MKIDYVLMGSNNNPLYLDFWPIVSKIWKEKFDITPVLGLITDDKNQIINDEFGIVYKFEKIEGYDDGLLSQLVRLYLPKLLEGVSIVSDIDIMPISQKYFKEDLKIYDKNDFLIMSSHHPQTTNKNEYPMCYIVGNNQNFNKLFNLNLDWEPFIKSIPNLGWYTDQKYLYDCVKKNKEINFVYPERENGFFLNRIDRINWSYDKEKLKNGFYIDSHLLRPYSFYKKEIDRLISLL